LIPVCGIPSRQRIAVAVLALAASACIYSFHGGGLPTDVKTMAILPFDNQTPIPGLESQLLQEMRKTLEARLGVRDASESKADAVVSGTITRYDADIPVGYGSRANGQAPTSTVRMLEMSVDVRIVDQKTGKALFERKGLSANGNYTERAEEAGRVQALQKLVTDMIEGAQSQWR
jgi:curli biogenesis system outer membrane secretion channel CsgG